SDEIVTEGIFSNLKLYASEHRLLVDIKKTLYALQGLKSCEFPPLLDYNEEYFNKFFLDLGSERSKELIKLFGRVKNEQNNRFKNEVYLLYSCMRDLYSPNVRYFNYTKQMYTNDSASRPTIDECYFALKTVIEKHTLMNNILDEVKECTLR
ncbi:membrane protein, partial (plasmid) [Borreliella bissettiae]